MIDIHTHILPGIDDGAADIYDTLEMVRIAAESGVKAMVATPHTNIPDLYDNYFGKEYVELVHKVKEAVKQEGIPVQILPGMEAFATEDLPERIREQKIMSLNQSSYLLMEFPFDADIPYAADVLQRVKAMGIRPVIAHVERYEFAQENPQIVYEWRKRGCLIQVNKGSFLGKFGRRARKAAYEFMDHNLVSVIASDAHSPLQRTPYLMDAYAELRGEYPEEYLNILFEENPWRICENKPTIRFQMRSFEESDEEV